MKSSFFFFYGIYPRKQNKIGRNRVEIFIQRAIFFLRAVLFIARIHRSTHTYFFQKRLSVLLFVAIVESSFLFICLPQKKRGGEKTRCRASSPRNALRIFPKEETYQSRSLDGAIEGTTMKYSDCSQHLLQLKEILV